MKKIISLLILISSLFFGCQRTSQQGIRQLSSANSTSPVVNSMPTNAPLIKRENTAVVISLHANLREKDNSSSAVLEVVPQDASVEVIKQQGAWFLVKTETNQGWLHGNTIKLQNFNTKVMTVEPPPTVKPKTTIETNDSGATAKCRDGTLSYSASRRGTCSHHGGVAVWY